MQDRRLDHRGASQPRRDTRDEDREPILTQHLDRPVRFVNADTRILEGGICRREQCVPLSEDQLD